MGISPLAGTPAPIASLIDVAKLVTAYYEMRPDPAIAAERVAFGTSGHRGSAFDASFNEWHILAITQAICDYRRAHDISGPLFLGIDTHALSEPACASSIEVLAANGVELMLARHEEYTPTPVISHAILTYNRGRSSGAADGIVITPSHNPPRDGGFKYNPPTGGPAAETITDWIDTAANRYLEARLRGVKRMLYVDALKAATTHRHDYLNGYVADLESVIDLAAIRAAKIRMGVDPLGGAGVHYWAAIAERFKLDLTVVSDVVDSRFAFMTLDWDGQIRMDPSSPYAMKRLIALKDRFDVAFACDTDHDRHGIVTPEAGLLPANHYLSVAIDYLFRHRPEWGTHAGIGKTVVTTRLIDALAAALERPVFETPVGFKWFSPGLLDGHLGFAGEQSAGATFLRRDGSVWTTDKDGIIAALLSAEITAHMGRDPGALYVTLAEPLGNPVACDLQFPATRAQKARLAELTPNNVAATALGGEPITSIISRAPGNDALIGGIKVSSASSWFAARPSGTENLYRIYAESFEGDPELQRILTQAQSVVDADIRSLAAAAPAA